jgi:hypothetical protein
MAFHLAQLNVARMRAPLDDPIMREFVAWLEPLNGLADTSPGFVWRLQTEQGDSTAIRAFEDPLLLVNISVWQSLDALRNYVFGSDHRRALRQRARWFERMDAPTSVLWWLPAGTLPTLDDAKKRLLLLRERGPTPEAFALSRSFPPPASGR